MTQTTAVLPTHTIRDFQCEFTILKQPVRFMTPPDYSSGFRPGLLHEADHAVVLKVEAYLDDPRGFSNASQFLMYNPRKGQPSDPVDPQQLDVLLELLRLSKQEPIIREKLDDLFKLHTLLYR